MGARSVIWAETTVLRPGAANVFRWEAHGIEALEVRLVAREESLPIGGGSPAVHVLSINMLGTDRCGRATVALPLQLPPSWAGRQQPLVRFLLNRAVVRVRSSR